MLVTFTTSFDEHLQQLLKTDIERPLVSKNLHIALALTPLIIEIGMNRKDIPHNLPLAGTARAMLSENYWSPTPEQVSMLVEALEKTVRIKTMLSAAELVGFRLPAIVVDMRFFASESSESHFEIEADIIAGAISKFRQKECPVEPIAV